MSRVSKRMKEANKVVNKEQALPIDAAFENISKFPKVKFDETVELHFFLNIASKTGEQTVRGTVALPHGIGKKVRVAVFCKGEQEAKARDAGADHVGSTDLIEKVSKGFMDFDVVVASPDMMKDLSKLGKVLGPRGLMPTPKAGTVTTDIERAIKEVKAGKIEFKSDKQSGVHVGIGKRSFSKEKLVDNARHVIDAINHAKPAVVKGEYIKSLFVSTTMGSSVRIAL